MSFDARVFAHVERLGNPGPYVVQRDAAVVYTEGMVAGLSLALSSLSGRVRIIDQLRRWEARLASVQVRHDDK